MGPLGVVAVDPAGDSLAPGDGRHHLFDSSSFKVVLSTSLGQTHASARRSCLRESSAASPRTVPCRQAYPSKHKRGAAYPVSAADLLAPEPQKEPARLIGQIPRPASERRVRRALRRISQHLSICQGNFGRPSFRPPDQGLHQGP
jgi:hypothetical protein